MLTFENKVLPGAVVSLRDLNLLLLQGAVLGLVLCCTWSPLLECTPLFRFYPASPGHDRDLVPSPSRNYRQQKKQENSDCEAFSGHYYLGAEARTTSMTARSWSEIKLHVSAVISRLFQIIWFAKTVHTIQKWNCRLEIKTNVVHTGYFTSLMDKNGCQMYKNENRSCKAC